MAPTKLSADDKKAIVQLYQAPGQTAATVAEEYGVSVSTISRLLRNELPAETYEALVRQKRGGGETRRKTQTRVSTKKPISKPKRSRVEAEDRDDPVPEDPAIALSSEEAEADPGEKPKSPARRRRSAAAASANEGASDRESASDGPRSRRPVSRRKRSSESADLPAEDTVEADPGADLSAEASPASPAPPLPAVDRPKKRKVAEPTQPRSRRRRRRSTADLEDGLEQESLELDDLESDEDDAIAEAERPTAQRDLEEADLDDGDDLDADAELAEDEDDEDDEDDDFEDAFEDDDFEEDDDEDDKVTSLRRRAPSAEVVQILPLADANLSRMLYLVIDRTAELVTMPMQHFSDLGQLPTDEEDRQTLPVFENHRVARRFSQRNQRVIKVPDGEMISKTSSWLEAKGITRCLLDGQVYSLEAADLN